MTPSLLVGYQKQAEEISDLAQRLLVINFQNGAWLSALTPPKEGACSSAAAPPASGLRAHKHLWRVSDREVARHCVQGQPDIESHATDSFYVGSQCYQQE